MKKWIFLLFSILILVGVGFVYIKYTSTHDQSEKTEKQEHHEFPDELSTLTFSLKPELDPKTLKKIQATNPISESIPVTLWVGGIDRLANGIDIVSKLPAHVGVLINPFDSLSKDILTLISKQKRQWALIIPTRSRFDGDNHSPATLNTSKESYDYFEKILTDTRIKTVFIPDMIDIDQEVLEFIVALAKKHKLTLIIPPQFFSNIPKLCDRQGVSYQLLDSFAPNAAIFDTFADILSESIEIMKVCGELKAAVMITDEYKEKYLMEYIQLVQTNRGVFIDVKPVMQAK